MMAGTILKSMYAKRPLVFGHRGARAYAPMNTLPSFELALEQGADGVELDAGFRFHERFKGTRIPTLREVFGVMGKTAFVNVEIKAPFQREPEAETTDDVERAVAECLLDLGMEDRVIVSSFNSFSLKRFRVILPDVPIAFLYATDVPFDTLALMAGIPHEAYHPQYKLATKETVDREHGRGRIVNVWTVNEAEEAKSLAAAGVDGIVTDKPDIILKALKK
jgi:glycerophosphoryl diester phosphodiesterase